MKKKSKRYAKRAMSFALAATMIPEMLLSMGPVVNAAVSNDLISALADLYDGDEARAREELEALYQAGVIDADGNMVELDIKEDGTPVTLEDITARIGAGEKVGALTVNNRAASQAQLMQIAQVKNLLAMVKLMSQDVEITDEHVANLESLIQGINDGSIDISEVLSGGTLSLASQKKTGSGNAAALGGQKVSDAVLRSIGNTVPADADGNYTASMIDGTEYESMHTFTLLDPSNANYYTDSKTEGVKTDGVVTLSCATTASAGGTVTVTAKLNKKLPYPVSFDWAAFGGAIGVQDTTSGTVTWAANDNADKTFTVKVANKGSDDVELWNGGRAFVISVGNLKGAVLEGGKTSWSQIVTVNANDSLNPWVFLGQIKGGEDGCNELDAPIPKYNDSYWMRGGLYTYNQVSFIPRVTPLRFTVTLNGHVKQLQSGDQNVVSSATLDIRMFNPTGAFASSPGTDWENWSDHDSIGWSIDLSVPTSQQWYEKIVEIPTADLEKVIVNNKTMLGSSINYETISGMSHDLFNYYYDWYFKNEPCPYIITVEAEGIPTVESVSVPKGTYYSGQVVPVTVTLSHYAQPDANTTLRVNGVDCPLIDASGINSRKITFGYTVKDVDTGAINVTGISNLPKLDTGVAFPSKSFGAAENVKLVSNVKQSSIDLAKAKFGISDDDAGQQVVTVMIPFKSGAKLDWVGNEAALCSTKGNSVKLPLPSLTTGDGMPNAEAKYFLKSAYFSYDNGKTRYPVYIVNNAGVENIALATRFAVPGNENENLRLDTLNLYMDTNIDTYSDTKYMDKWENAQKDEQGFAYFTFDGSKDEAPVCIGTNYSYYVKGSVMFEQDQTASRGTADYADRVQNGWLKLDDGNYILLQDAAHPENQYDVEIVGNEAFYQGCVAGARAEDNKEMTLNWQVSGRKKFTFTDPKYFEWSCSNPSVANIETTEDGECCVSLTGMPGKAEFTLTVGNGSDSKKYKLSAGTLTVLEGKSPFLNISKFSQKRHTLTDTDTDIMFASNVTDKNKQAGHENTTFTAKLYKAKESGDGYKKDGDVIWTADFDSTMTKSLNNELVPSVTHITVPGEQLNQPGAYAVEITTQYLGGEIEGVVTEKKTLTESAVLLVKQAPVKVTLNPLESYYVTPDTIPEIGYSLTTANAEVEYTIQKTGEDVSERMQAANGKIPFTAGKPNSLKEAYTITVYARNNAEDPWSVDSMLLTVYNPDILQQIVSDVTESAIGGTTGGTGESVTGKTVQMDNHGKLGNYGANNSNYQLTFEDFTTLRTDMSLQKIVSVNYGEATYGLLSDKMEWKTSNNDLVSINYEQGGLYSDIRNYSYTSYTPATDLLLVGKGDTGDDKVTITATHANTGISSSFDVTAKTLKDQLYVFQFYPAVKTDVIYTNGKGQKRTLQSNENGELAVYEPDGIADAIMAKSQQEDKTYVGTLFPTDLESGERDIASLQLYPCNNLRLREISNATLTFKNPDGSDYNGHVTLRGGVYKNGIYCPSALIRVGDDGVQMSGREDISATVKDGKLDLRLDPMQFKIDPNDSSEFGGAQPGDSITYVFEYRFDNTYQPGYVTLKAFTNIYGASSATDSLITLRKITGGDSQPQIVHQSLRQFYDGVPTPFTRDVIGFTDNIGISKRLDKAELSTEVALLGEEVALDDKGYAIYTGDSVANFVLCNANNVELTGQNGNDQKTAKQITNLSEIDNASLFVFPFSAVPMARSVYTMTDENLVADGITDQGDKPNPTSQLKAVFKRGNTTVKNETLSFGVSNLSHQRDLSADDGGAKDVGNEVKDELKSRLDMGKIFGDIDVNDFLKKGFVFLSKMKGQGGDSMLDMMILPTQDPGTFRIMVFIGDNTRDDNDWDNKEGMSVNYEPNRVHDDMKSFEKEMKALEKKKKKKNQKDGDNDDDKPYSFNFYGAVVLEARIGILGNKWGIDFCGGNAGTNFELKYDWNQNFMCGPIPINISFEIKATADLEVAFANKKDVRALLIDAAIGVSINAFMGLGFDFSIIALKFGINGNISAEDNFLYLTKGNQTGNMLEIKGEIGLRFEVKVVLVKYQKTFCSTGFNWSKKWGKYDQIKDTWEKEGYADLSGKTKGGKPFTMRLMKNGIATVEIDGGSQVEDRDYLKKAARKWNNSVPQLTMNPSDGMTELESNAYAFANPVLSDDGSLLLYISDNDNPDAPETVVCYAVKDGNGYRNIGRVDGSEDNILADSDVVVSGNEQNAFAAWVKQMDTPEKELKMKDIVTFDDLGTMINATEVYAGAYKDGQWTVERLTDNTVGDMAPAVASSGNRAIVAWRSLSASKMPENAEQDLTAMFDAENNLNYRIFDGNEWKEAKIAYNGASGTVNAVDAAMLPDGTSMLVYTVRTTDDVTGSETFYTLVDKDGEVLTTGRLTNDNYTDTNAQVTTVGDQFILGWYSEHAADEVSDSAETVVSHDIGLARINANGSVDAEFPESIGGTSASTIGNDFHFSAPENNDDLSKLSIVWSQQKKSDAAEDAGKHQLNAVRFYEENGVIGVTAQTVIAESAKNYTIDKFDTYTDASGAVNAVLVGSDYSAVETVNVYDTIDMSELPVEAVNESGETSDLLAVLEQEPIVSMKLAKGAFQQTAISAEAEADLYNLMPGLNMPVQFNVQNTGTTTVKHVTANVGGQTQEFTNLNLLPGQSIPLVFSYSVPETVSDVEYTLTADGIGTAAGTLMLNRPDVGIASMKVTRESEKTRDIQVILGNAADIPLVGSNKTVKLAFYKDSNYNEQIGKIITIDPSAYQDIDDDIYTYQQTLNVSDFIGNAEEIPENGIRIYANAWIEDTDELYTHNNSASVVFNGLLAKYETPLRMDASLVSDENNAYSVVADISNNSLQEADIGTVTADILDKFNKIIASVPLSESAITLEGEQSRSFTVPVPQLSKEPVTVSLRSSEKSVLLDARTNGGNCDAATIMLNKENKPAGQLPEAYQHGYKFEGWFTKPKGGELITEDTVLEGGQTVYAQFTYIQREQTFEIGMDSYEYDGTAHTPEIIGTAYGKVTTEYYNADTNELLTEAPTEAGHYEVRVKADGNYYYLEGERTAEYWISMKNSYHVSVKNGTINGETSGEFEPNTLIIAQSDEPAEGYKFGYWKRNGATASYNNIYTFPMTEENITLEAVYLAAGDTFEAKGSSNKDAVEIDEENKKISFTFLNNVPNDCTIVKGGVVATCDETKLDDLFVGIGSNAEKTTFEKVFTTDKHNYSYKWTKNNVAEDQTWFVKGYLVYKDAEGTEHTVYSAMEKATLKGSETVVEDEIVGVALMNAVKPNKTENKIAFEALLNVPADCTIKFAGVVATSDDEKGANLTAENADFVRGMESVYHTVKYTWTKTKVTEDQTWYVKPYLVYTNANGKEFTVYGELNTGKLN